MAVYVLRSRAQLGKGSQLCRGSGDEAVEAGHCHTVVAHLALLRASKPVPGLSTALPAPLATDDKESPFSPTIHLLSVLE